MKRRTLVMAAGVCAMTISGCLGSGSSRGMNGEYPTVSVQADEEQQQDVSMTVEVTQQFSESNPAKIKISFTNDSDSETQFTFGASPPFSQYVSQDGSSPKLVIIPETNNSHIVVDGEGTTRNKSTDESNRLPPEIMVDDCWELPGNLTVYTSAKQMKIAAGETITEEYAVLNHPSNQHCLPARGYRFVSQNYFGQNQPWGFSVKVKEK